MLLIQFGLVTRVSCLAAETALFTFVCLCVCVLCLLACIYESGFVMVL